MTAKYRCLGCEDPCVLEIAMAADQLPHNCPWQGNVKWELWQAAQEQPNAVEAQKPCVSCKTWQELKANYCQECGLKLRPTG